MVNRVLRKLVGKFFTFWVRRRASQVGPGLKVNWISSVTSRTILGDNVNFNGMKILGHGKVTIGDNFHSGEDCLIITSNHNFDSGETIPYDGTNIIKDTKIEDNVWLGSRVVILPGVSLGEGCIAQAGSVIVKDVPPCAIVGGNPAVVFKYRDKDHYYKLKALGRFA